MNSFCVLAAAVLGLGSSDQAHDERELPVRVVSFNIRYGTAPDGPNSWPHRRQLVVEVLQRGSYDFIGLQEALRFQLDELNHALPRYGEIGVGRTDGRSEGEHSSILFRTDRWAVDQAQTFWLSDTPSTPGSATWGNRIPRVVTWARFIHKATGTAVYVFNTHFDHQSQPSREKSAQLLAKRIATRQYPDPVIVTGDFNAVESEPTIRWLTNGSGPVRLIDTYRHLHPARSNQEGTFHAFQGGLEGRRIDYVFVTPDVRIRSARIIRYQRDGRYPSDHYPVEAELHLPIRKDK